MPFQSLINNFKVFCSYLAVSVLRTYVGMPIAKPTDRQAGGAVER